MNTTYSLSDRIDPTPRPATTWCLSPQARKNQSNLRKFHTTADRGNPQIKQKSSASFPPERFIALERCFQEAVFWVLEIWHRFFRVCFRRAGVLRFERGGQTAPPDPISAPHFDFRYEPS
jgi:hypothetical protein